MKRERKHSRNDDLERELQSDLELEAEEQRENGQSPEEARYAALRAFGNTTTIAQQTREQWQWAPFARVLHDLRFALRQLTRSPGFTVAAVLTLALGIGTTTAIFSLVNAVLLRPLPFPQSGRLMWLSQQDHSLPGQAPEPLSFPDYFDWRAQNHTFDGIAVYEGGGTTLQVKGEAQRLDAETVSSNLFQVLGVTPMLGRDFRLEEEKPGNRAAMLSYALWQSTFGSDPSIAGKSIRIDNHDYTVAGVMPRGFQFPLESPGPALWVSLADEEAGSASSQRGFDVLDAIGRLKPGVTPLQGKADLSLIAGQLARQYPDTNKQESSALVVPQLEHMTGDTRPAMRILFGAVLLLLLIVCANVAGLLLVRAARRSGEFALRVAIGASRGAIIRQLLVESVTLALGGGLAGIALGYGLLHAVLSLMPLDIPRMQNASIDPGVLAFALAVSLATGLLFGVLPAWRISKPAPSLAMRNTSRSLAGGRSQNRIHNSLVVAQTAVGLVLLVSSGLLIRSFVRILHVDPGFDPRQLLTARAGVPFEKATHNQHLLFYQQLLARISAMPGVQSASAGWPLPMSTSFATINFNIQGRPIAKGDEPSAPLGLAMPGFFETMRIPLLAGRAFDQQDGLHGAPSMIVNQAFANKYFPGENPLGQHIQVGLGDDVFEHPMRLVVGVVGNIHQKGLTEVAQPAYYLPFAQAMVTNPYLVVRTSGNPLLLQDAIRAATHDMDKNVPLYQVSTMQDYVSHSAAQSRFQTFLFACFTAIALFLAAIGLYGLLSYMVVQRTVEIGLRMALGAQRSDILAIVVRNGLTLAIIGITVGLALSAILTRLLSGMLYGTRPTDPLTFALTTAVLLLMSIAASGIPALRAARLDPTRALREQ